MALHTGCRKNELLKLERSRVDFKRRVFVLEAKQTKARRRWIVPLNDEAIAVLKTQLEWVERCAAGARWVFAVPSVSRLTMIEKGFRVACGRAGIADFHVHDLRHSFASWLVMGGASLYVARDLRGYSSITATKRYTHLAPHCDWADVASAEVWVAFEINLIVDICIIPSCAKVPENPVRSGAELERPAYPVDLPRLTFDASMRLVQRG